MTSTGSDLIRCSFCGAGRDEAKKLIKGTHVYICAACVAVGRDALAEHGRPTTALPLDLRCSFCGRTARDVDLVPGPDVQICGQCLDLCHDIITEELAAPAE